MTRILAVDMGNSFTKYALFEDGAIKATWRHPTAETQSTADAILAATDAPVVLSSVVPKVAAQLESICAARGRQLVKIASEHQTTITCPSGELGADLLAGAVAARKLYAPDKDLVVIGLGTASTLVGIRADGRFNGVYITLGLTPTLEEIARRCALVPQFAIEELTSLKPGFNTKDAVLAGAFKFLLGGVKEWILGGKEDMGADCVTVGTGGWSTTVAKHTTVLDHVDPDLVLKGIYFLAEAALNAPAAPTPSATPATSA